MIEIGGPEDGVPRALLERAGAFAWWYADLVDERGDGLVLIWSWGLPFLPGYAGAARRGAPQRPVDRPSVNVVLYRAGRPAFYLLQEHPADGAFPHPGDLSLEQRIGRCRFVRETRAGRLSLVATLDCAVPGTDARLTGTVRVEGAARGGRSTGDATCAPHVWTPLTGPAIGEADLAFGGEPLARLRGRAYHDRNHGTVPLHDLGIERWIWGRVPLADRERIYYLLWPEGGGAPLALGMDVDAEGCVTRVEPEVETMDERRGPAGLRRPGGLALRVDGRPWLSVVHRRVADEGPFYLRLLTEAATGEGERALGWGELCRPDRVDLGLHRPFVRMRVHQAVGPNSPWLPLFTGPRRGRVRRLLRHVLSGSGSAAS